MLEGMPACACAPKRLDCALGPGRPHFTDKKPSVRDHSHHSPDNTGYCAHCGQALPGSLVPAYGTQRTNVPGLAGTVLLHLIVLLCYFFYEKKDTAAPPPSGTDITYIQPLPGKPKKQELAEAAPKPVKKPVKPTKREVARIERLPDTITLPNETPAEVVEVPPKEIEKLPPEMDMSEMIAAKRRARGQDTTEQQGEESASDRGNRIARENIARANGRSAGPDANDTGGIFDIVNKSFSGADVKFRGWNPSFKRRWLQQVRVELGTERDIETAIVKKMIEIIRKEKTGDFDWDSHRLQRVVKLSARPADQAELEAFLFKEMFPGYRPPAGR